MSKDKIQKMQIDNQFLKRISEATFRKTIDQGLDHARQNKQFIDKTIKDLSQELAGNSQVPALVVSAGPSLHRRRHLQVLKQIGFSGHVVAVDGSLGHCLRNGIIPDFVVTVDPHPYRIIRWFGDPYLADRPKDDYFQRQDLDPELRKDEVKKNQELIGLVNEYGYSIKLIIATSVSPEVTTRCIEAGMKLYWWNPLYDDFEDPTSYSRSLYNENRVPCMVTGGNCGSSAWVFAHAILRSAPILMVGMDFSYPPGTDVYNTQYYEIFKELFHGHPENGLIEVENPHLGQVWVTDPGYYWYANNFLEMARHADRKTINCTEGGILFGSGVEWATLAETLNQLKAEK